MFLPLSGGAEMGVDGNKRWTHRLCNLVLLHAERNSAASNTSFSEKKVQYGGQQGHTGTSSIPLTDEVSKKAEWGPEQVEEQHNRMVQLAYKCWQLYTIRPQQPSQG